MSDKLWFLQVDDGSGRRDATPDEIAEFKALTPARVFQEYPKMLEGGRVVTSAAEEAAWTAPADVTVTHPAPEPVPDAEPSPLDSIELDGAATNDGHVPEPEPDDAPNKSSTTASHGGAKKK